MQPRIDNPALTAPGAMQALQRLAAASKHAGLPQAATRLADRSDPVPDDVWEQAARHYDERQLGALVLAIAAINAWNRINATTRQITGEWVTQWIRIPNSQDAAQAA
jgi:hypothetical protein